MRNAFHLSLASLALVLPACSGWSDPGYEAPMRPYRTAQYSGRVVDLSTPPRAVVPYDAADDQDSRARFASESTSSSSDELYDYTASRPASTGKPQYFQDNSTTAPSGLSPYAQTYQQSRQAASSSAPPTFTGANPGVGNPAPQPGGEQRPAGPARPQIDPRNVAAIRDAVGRGQPWQKAADEVAARLETQELRDQVKERLGHLAPQITQDLINNPDATGIVTVAVYREPGGNFAPTTSPTGGLGKQAMIAVAFEGFIPDIDPTFFPRVLSDMPRPADDRSDASPDGLILDAQATSYVTFMMLPTGLGASSIPHDAMKQGVLAALREAGQPEQFPPEALQPEPMRPDELGPQVPLAPEAEPMRDDQAALEAEQLRWELEQREQDLRFREYQLEADRYADEQARRAAYDWAWVDQYYYGSYCRPGWRYPFVIVTGNPWWYRSGHGRYHDNDHDHDKWDGRNDNRPRNNPRPVVTAQRTAPPVRVPALRAGERAAAVIRSNPNRARAAQETASRARPRGLLSQQPSAGLSANQPGRVNAPTTPWSSNRFDRPANANGPTFRNNASDAAKASGTIRGTPRPNAAANVAETPTGTDTPARPNDSAGRGSRGQDGAKASDAPKVREANPARAVEPKDAQGRNTDAPPRRQSSPPQRDAAPPKREAAPQREAAPKRETAPRREAAPQREAPPPPQRVAPVTADPPRRASPPPRAAPERSAPPVRRDPPARAAPTPSPSPAREASPSRESGSNNGGGGGGTRGGAGGGNSRSGNDGGSRSDSGSRGSRR